MTTKEQIEYCITRLEEGIARLEYNPWMGKEEALGTLDRDLHRGVCYLLSHSEFLGSQTPDWIVKHIGSDEFGDKERYNNYWCAIPRYCVDTVEIIKTLKHRLSICKQELKLL